jgi:hypothetical protein
MTLVAGLRGSGDFGSRRGARLLLVVVGRSAGSPGRGGRARLLLGRSEISVAEDEVTVLSPRFEPPEGVREEAAFRAVSDVACRTRVRRAGCCPSSG